MTTVVPQIVFVLGGPGAGKGTQCSRIVAEFGYVHLSAGDLLREEKLKGGVLGNMISDYIKDGKIIPVEITIRLIKAAMDVHSQAGRSKFLIDGFPRNEDNLSGWKSIMGDKCNIQFVLFLDCPEALMEKRLLGRNEGRADDNIDSIRKRFGTYIESTMPIIKTFEADGLLRRVSADADPDAVFKEVSALFRPTVLPKSSPTSAAGSSTPFWTDDAEALKKKFSACLADSVRLHNRGDPEAGKKALKKSRQFWELSSVLQQDMLVNAVRKAVFNPVVGVNGCIDVKWQVAGAALLSISGGYHVYAHEQLKNGTHIQHHCRVNSYGVLEWYKATTQDGCVIS